jgi:ABC-type enterochelin transport system permease subunit
MEDKNTNPLVLLLAWINYIISYLFSTPFLSKIALVMSIIGSGIYIYNQYNQFKKNKKNDSKIN